MARRIVGGPSKRVKHHHLLGGKLAVEWAGNGRVDNVPDRVALVVIQIHGGAVRINLPGETACPCALLRIVGLLASVVGGDGLSQAQDNSSEGKSFAEHIEVEMDEV